MNFLHDSGLLDDSEASLLQLPLSSTLMLLPFEKKSRNILPIVLNPNNKINNLIEELKKRQSFNDITKFTIENFQTTKDVKLCNVHLCRYKKTLDELTKLNLECHTITQNQGSTINEKYMIHDLKALPRDQLITALTRATKWDDIYIYF